MRCDRAGFWWCVPLLLAAGMATAAEPVPAGQLLDFGPTFDFTKLTANSSRIARGGTLTAPGLRVTTNIDGSWPGVTVPSPIGHWDLSSFEFITLDAHNIDTHDIDVYVRIDNPGADGGSRCMTERIGTQPDQRVTLTIPLKRVSKSTIKLFGMNGFPQGLYTNGGIDPANIVALTIFTDDHPKVSSSFEVTNVRAFGVYRDPPWATMDEAAFFPFIDRYGQFMHKEWPGKVHSDAELIANREAEAKALAGSPGPRGWDSWGGWNDGPQLEATGHFRTAKHEGRWWLVDPAGKLFFSTGLTCVGWGGASTPIDDRERWFSWLPTAADEAFMRFRNKSGPSWGGGYYAGKSPVMVDFSGANLLRKYGPEWSALYPEMVHRRLRAWGINTLGNWSEPGFCAMQRTPYTRTFWYETPQLNNSGFPDVFDPGFGAALDKGTAKFLGTSVSDPWCIGFFVDNEMSWGGDTDLAKRALASPATAAAKRALSDWLRARHPDIAQLNTAWGTTWAT